MASLFVVDRRGSRRNLETAAGWRAMEFLRDQNIGVSGLCGGSCICGTCHVIVAPEWAHRLPEPREDELAKLDELPAVAATSRLSCQIIWSDDLDGLTLILPAAA